MAFATGLAAQAARNATRLSRFDPPGRSFNDVWGYADPTGAELAFLGADNGTFLVDCTNPTNPVQIGFVPGPVSGWRDMKTYREYLYIVTEGGGGVQIIDLHNPRQPVFLGTWGAQFWNNAHNVFIDTTTGAMYPCGTNVGTVVVDLSQNPAAPSHKGAFGGPYVHDLYVRGNLAFLAENGASMLEARDLSTLPPALLGGAALNSCHNAWLTRDGNTLITSAEWPGIGMTVFDVSNPRLPTKIAVYRVPDPTKTIHNVFARDGVAHASYYAEGYRAVDLTDPRTPVEVAAFDATAAEAGFVGYWGCYPFQPSGAVYCSDRAEGLIVLATDALPAHYGSGSGGAVPPRIRSFGAAYFGNPRFALELEGAPPNARGLLVVGVAAATTPVLGVSLLVDLARSSAALPVTADAIGATRVALPVPALVPPARLYAQFLVQDAAAPLGVAASEGLALSVFAK